VKQGGFVPKEGRAAHLGQKKNRTFRLLREGKFLSILFLLGVRSIYKESAARRGG